LSDTTASAAAVLLCAIPLALTVWALLDAAGRPDWAWALAGRRRVVWLAAILFGAMSVVMGLAVSLVYLARVRQDVAAAESGRVSARVVGPAAGPVVGVSRVRGGEGPNSSVGGGP
jgi:MFS family permease